MAHPKSADLDRLRAQIDHIDKELLKLINARAEVAVEVGNVKRAIDTDPVFYRPEREANLLRSYHESNPGPLSNNEAARLMREIMSACLAMENPLTVAYLGPDGTYTHIAALKHFGGSVKTAPQSSIDDVVRAVEVGNVDFGVLPVENSVEGSVNQTLDVLIESQLKIFGEVNVEIQHQLLSNAGNLQAIEVIYGHPQALAQCRRWLDHNLPQVKQVAVPSNAEGARIAGAESASAAIASSQAGELYELAAVESNIEDHAHNTTRFVVLGKYSPPPSGNDLTSIMFTMPNKPGALHAVLQLFDADNISMTRIESRPLRQGTWEYLFFVDLEGHAQTSPLSEVLEKLGERTSLLKVLGSYPRAMPNDGAMHRQK